LSQIRPCLEDPRLSAAAASLATGDLRAAAAALGAALEQHKPAGAELGRWRYAQAQLLAKAGDSASAAQLFDLAAAAEGWLAAPYARLAAARAYGAAGRHAEAVERAAGISEELPIATEARLLRAESLEAAGDKAAAAELWKAQLRAKKRGPRWADLSTRVAGFLLEGTPDAAQAREAAELLRAVTIEAPASGAAAKARQLLPRALEVLPAEQRAPLQRLTTEERLQQAQALLDGGRREDAIKACNALVDELEPRQREGKVACDAAVLKASASSKTGRRAVGADAWAEAVQRCEAHKGQLLTALFQGAKQTMSAGRTQDAARLYARVEAEFSSHSYADDARLRGARIARLMGDEARSQQMLSKMPTDYPDGDMLEDGLFELALRQMERQDWSSALATLQRSLELRPVEKPHHAAGRARYFAARMHGMLGRPQQQAEGLQQVVREHPFSYYMVQAWSHLAASDSKAAMELLRARDAQEPAGSLAEPGAELQRPAFARALELLQLGEPTLAREEVLSLGLSAEAHAGSLWTIANLYSRAGAPELGFRVARSRTADWSTHYPAGRWRLGWELAYPRVWPSIMDREAGRAGLPISVGYGIMREESLFDAAAVSSANAYGLMQLIVPTAKTVAAPLGLPHDPDALRRPEVNIALGTHLLASLRSSFAQAPVLAIPSYNAGPGATHKWLANKAAVDFDLWVELIPYEETRNYTKRVTASIAAYAWLYEPARFEAIARLPLQLRN
jgi:soluble lytic murein transglycosylase